MHQYCFVCGFSSFFLAFVGPSHGRFHRRSQAPRVDRPEVSTSIAPDLPAPLRRPSRSTAPRQHRRAFVVAAARPAASAPAPDPGPPRRIAAGCPHRVRAHPERIRRVPIRPIRSIGIDLQQYTCASLRYQPVQPFPLLLREPHDVLFPHLTPSRRLWSRDSRPVATGGFRRDGTLASRHSCQGTTERVEPSARKQKARIIRAEIKLVG